MQILELQSDRWLERNFAYSPPADIRIATDDAGALVSYPEHRWVYNRLRLAESQDIECGPAHVVPTRYPVLCRRMLNTAANSDTVVNNDYELRQRCGPDDFWMRLQSGVRVTSDVTVVKGEAAWFRHTTGVRNSMGAVDYWIVEERIRPRLEDYCADWIRANLSGYTGMVGLETNGGRIVNVRLTFSDQWPDLYGQKWRDALILLRERQTWELVDTDRPEGYSIELSGCYVLTPDYPKPHLLAGYRQRVGISSIKLSFLQEHPIGMPAEPGRLRLAVINSFNLTEGLRVRDAMARDFGCSA